MAAITNYSTLVQALKDETENDGIEFAAFLPTAIDLSEERIFRELELPDLETNSTGNLIPSTKTFNKPADYYFTDFLSVTLATGRKVVLKKKTQSFLEDYWPVEADVDTPKYYADYSDTQFMVAPTSDTALAYTLKYSAKPIKLSTTNATNYYTTKTVDVLFASCMVEVLKFQKQWEILKTWESVYIQARDTWNIQASRSRRDGGVMPMATEASPNSLKHTLNTNA